MNASGGLRRAGLHRGFRTEASRAPLARGAESTNSNGFSIPPRFTLVARLCKNHRRFVHQTGEPLASASGGQQAVGHWELPLWARISADTQPASREHKLPETIRKAHDCRALRGLTPTARGYKNQRQWQHNRVLTHAAGRRSIARFCSGNAPSYAGTLNTYKAGGSPEFLHGRDKSQSIRHTERLPRPICLAR